MDFVFTLSTNKSSYDRIVMQVEAVA